LDKAKKEVDDGIRGKYALPEDLTLVEEDEETKKDAKEEWEKGRRQLRLQEGSKRRKLGLGLEATTTSSSTTRRLLAPSSSLSKSKVAPSDPVASLRARILSNTARQADSFTSNRQKPLGLKESSIMIRR
jgi:coiled-coil domain-containing protein 130